MINKKFTDNRSGQTLSVSDLQDGIAVMNDGTKILASRLLNVDAYTEYIDPNSFFNSSPMGNIMSDIQKIDENRIPENANTSVVTKSESVYDRGLDDVYTTEVDEESLKRKAIEDQKKLSDKMRKQQEAFSKYNDDEPNETGDHREPVRRERPPFESDQNQYITQENTTTQLEHFDPMVKMFRGIKRNNEIKISFTVDEMVPRKDFIEMWEESYEKSIIDFLADEFTQKILSNPDVIKESIAQVIKNYTYGDIPVKTIEEQPKQPRKPRVKKTETK